MGEVTPRFKKQAKPRNQTGEPLTPELLALMDCEKVIEQWVRGGIDAGYALKEIRDKQHYKAIGCKTFEQYAKDRWGYSKSYTYSLIDAAKTLTVLEASANADVLPSNEGSVRDLAPIVKSDPEVAGEIWDDAVGRAQERRKDDDPRPVAPTARDVKEAIKARAAVDDRVEPPEPPIKKPKRGTVSHPAVFSDALLPVFAALLAPGMRVLDPFAGTGRVHKLRDLIDVETVGIELEPEWAELHPDTHVGNALALDFPDSSFDAIVTSPTYGNRLADHHNAADPEARRSYTHDLGRPLAEDNSGDLQWGQEYRDFHKAAWKEADRVLRPGSRFVLNIKDHIRAGNWIDVAAFHVDELVRLGLHVVAIRPVITGHLRQGENAEARVPAELVVAFDKP